MLLITYDFSNDKTRTRFSKFLEKYGVRIQYSVFKIRNSKRIIDNIKTEIELKYKKKFAKTDSVYVFSICEGCNKNILKYGSAIYEDEKFVIM